LLSNDQKAIVAITYQKVIAMTALAVRGLPVETHRALKMRAASHGRSTEAEIRAILQEAVRPSMRLGSALTAIGRGLGGVELVLSRDKTKIRPAIFK
jgi:antitoxin FitA